MPRLSRRSFVGWLGAVAASVGLAPGRLRAHAPGHAARPPEPPSSGTAPAEAALDPALLDALAAVVLPRSLGTDGQRRGSAAFRRWIAGYRAGAEAVHGYGTGELRALGASPEPRWREQLATLDSAARARHGKGFIALTAGAREVLVREALAGERGPRLPSPLAASHVALALLAHWASTPEATDLCYDARIARQQCRPLVNAPKEPVKLGRATGATGGGRA